MKVFRQGILNRNGVMNVNRFRLSTILRSTSDTHQSMIFLPEVLDNGYNWTDFLSQLTDLRNIHVLDPSCLSNYDPEQISDQIVNYMDQHQIQSASIVGHGIGGKMALMTGCYQSHRVTGVCVLDSGPLDHRYYEAGRELKEVIQVINSINLQQSRDTISQQLKVQIECPKWRSLVESRLDHNNKWNISQSLLDNINDNHQGSLLSWHSQIGMFTGRVCFVFNDHSRWVHLNNNTLAMMRVCVRAERYQQDMWAIQTDDNILNHWVYDFSSLNQSFLNKLRQFLVNYDGVPALMKSRQELRGEINHMSNYTHRNLNHN